MTSPPRISYWQMFGIGLALILGGCAVVQWVSGLGQVPAQAGSFVGMLLLVGGLAVWGLAVKWRHENRWGRDYR